MTLKRRLSIIAGIAAGVLLIGAVWVGYSFYAAVQQFLMEDNVVHAGWAVVDAIEQYEEAAGQPPRTLAALVPEYLPALPTAPDWPGVDNITFIREDEPDDWWVRMHSSEFGERRLYVFNSKDRTPPADWGEHIGFIHGWDVLRAERED